MRTSSLRTAALLALSLAVLTPLSRASAQDAAPDSSAPVSSAPVSSAPVSSAPESSAAGTGAPAPDAGTTVHRPGFMERLRAQAQQPGNTQLERRARPPQVRALGHDPFVAELARPTTRKRVPPLLQGFFSVGREPCVRRGEPIFQRPRKTPCLSAVSLVLARRRRRFLLLLLLLRASPPARPLRHRRLFRWRHRRAPLPPALRAPPTRRRGQATRPFPAPHATSSSSRSRSSSSRRPSLASGAPCRGVV